MRIYYPSTVVLAASAYLCSAYGQELSCPANTVDSECLEQAFYAACGSPATQDSCRRFLGDLEQLPTRGDVRVGLLAGAANVALASFSDDATQKEEFTERAREIYREVLSRAPNNADALLGLATTAQTREERIAYLRRHLEARPTQIRAYEFLANALKEGGPPAEVEEAAEVLEQAYELEPPSDRKWGLAAGAMVLYESGSAAGRAEALRARTRQDFGLNRAMATLTNPETVNTDTVRQELLSVCSMPLIYVLDATSCLEGLKSVTDAALDTTQPSGVTAELVDSVSVAIRAAVEASVPLNAADPGWRTQFEDTLERFLTSGVASRQTYGAYAAVTPDRFKRLETLRAAAERFPQDGALALARGLASFDVGNKREAIESLSRAKTLLPESRHAFIDQMLQRASELRE